MRNFRVYMIFQWVFFLPIILPLCIVFGALRGIVQMIERVMEQIVLDIAPSERNTTQAVTEHWTTFSAYIKGRISWPGKMRPLLFWQHRVWSYSNVISRFLSLYISSSRTKNSSQNGSFGKPALQISGRSGAPGCLIGWIKYNRRACR